MQCVASWWMSFLVDPCLSDCNPYGDASCCVAQGIFGMDETSQCFITNSVDEQSEITSIPSDSPLNLNIDKSATGTIANLTGNNPVQAPCYEQYVDAVTPAIISPVYTWNGTGTPPTGTIATPAATADVTQTANGTCIRKGAASSSYEIMPGWAGLVGLVALFLTCV